MEMNRIYSYSFFIRKKYIPYNENKFKRRF
nr:MAG TPA: hypothetical protein [Caudoviricetes sp.]